MIVKPLISFLGIVCYRKMEYCFNTDFNSVRIIISELPSQFGARAFTDGSDIYILPRYAQPQTLAGQWLIAHELAHIVQQRQERVPTRGVTHIVLDTGLEDEANLLGLCALFGFQVNGNPVISFSNRSQIGKAIQCSLSPSENEGYQSDLDDEKPPTREHYDAVVSVIRDIHKNLRLLTKGERVAKLIAEVKLQIEQASKALDERANASPLIPVFEIKRPLDWFIFANAMRKFLNENYPKENKYPKGKSSMEEVDSDEEEEEEEEQIDASKVEKVEKELMQYLPAYDFRFKIWDGASNDRIQVRRVAVSSAKKKLLLLDPGTGEGRPYRQMAYDLYKMSQLLGAKILKIEPRTDAEFWRCGQLGQQILASALMYIYAGRGNEVHSWVKEILSQPEMQQLENLILEYIGLNFGFEPGRLPYTQFDNLINLANIATGATFGFGKREQRFGFLNVLSWVREIGGQYKHIYAIGDGMDPKYKGFLIGDLEQSLSKYDDNSQRKVTSSLGKAFATSSGTFYWVRFFLKALSLRTKIRNAVYDQVKNTPSEKSTFHQQRFKLIGPVRIYNTIANLLRNSGIRDSEYESTSLLGYAEELINGAYVNFLLGKEADSATFGHLFPSERFVDSVSIIKEESDDRENEILKLREIFAAILGDPKLNDYHQKISAGKKELLSEFRAYVAKHQELISRLFQSYPSQVAELIRFYANHCFTDNYSFLQKALMIGHVGLIDALSENGANWNYANKSAAVSDMLVLHDSIANLYKKGSLLINTISEINPGLRYSTEWLLSDHVEGVLNDYHNRRVKEKLPGNLIIMPAESNCDRLSGRNQVMIYLKQGIEKLRGNDGVIIVPIHWSTHWCNLVIRNTKDGISAYYFDSSGKDSEHQETLKGLLNNCKISGWDPANNFHDLSLAIQQDGYTCGTWATEAGKIIAQGCFDNLQVDQLKRKLIEDLDKLQPVIERVHDSNWSTHASGLSRLALEVNEASHPLYKIRLQENIIARNIYELIKTHLGSDTLESTRIIEQALNSKDIPYNQLKLAMQSLTHTYRAEDIFAFAVNNKIWSLVNDLLTAVQITPKIIELITVAINNMGKNEAAFNIIRQAFHYYLNPPDPNTRYWLDSTTLQQLISKMKTDKIYILPPYDAHDLNPGRILEAIINITDKPIICPINLGNGNWALLSKEGNQLSLYFPADARLEESVTGIFGLLGSYTDCKVDYIKYNAKHNDLKGAYILSAIDSICDAVEKNLQSGSQQERSIIANTLAKETLKISERAEVTFNHHKNETGSSNIPTYSEYSFSDDKWLDSSQINQILYKLKTNQKKAHILSAGSFGERNKTSLQQNILNAVKSDSVDPIIVPVNCRNRHWCNLLIYKDHGGTPIVLFFDSKGKIAENKDLALEAIELLKGEYKRLEFIDLSQCVQSNNYACGTWMTNSAEWLTQVYQDKKNEGVLDANTLAKYLEKQFKEIYLKHRTEREINQHHEDNLTNFPKVDAGFTGIEVEKAKEFPDAKLKQLKSEENEEVFKLAHALYSALKDEQPAAAQRAYKDLSSLSVKQKELALYYCHHHLLVEDKKHSLGVAIRLKDPFLFREFFNRMNRNTIEVVEGIPLLDIVTRELNRSPDSKELQAIAEHVWQGLSKQSKFGTKDKDLHDILIQEIQRKEVTVLETYDMNSPPHELFSTLKQPISSVVVCPIILKDGAWALLVKHDLKVRASYSLMVQDTHSTKQKSQNSLKALLQSMLGAEVSVTSVKGAPMALISELENKLREFNQEKLLEPADVSQRTSDLVKKYDTKENQPLAVQTLLEESIMDRTLSVADACDSINQLNGLGWSPKSIWQGKEKFTSRDCRDIDISEAGMLLGCKNIIRKIDGEKPIEYSNRTFGTGRKRKTVSRFDTDEVGLIDFSQPLTGALPNEILAKAERSDSNLILWMAKVDVGYYFPVLYDRSKNEVHYWDHIPSAKDNGQKDNLMKWVFSRVKPAPRIQDRTADAIKMSNGGKRGTEQDTSGDPDERRRKPKPKLVFEKMFNAAITCMVNYIDHNEGKEKVEKPRSYYQDDIQMLASTSTFSSFVKKKLFTEFKINSDALSTTDKQIRAIIFSGQIKEGLEKFFKEITISLNDSKASAIDTTAHLMQKLSPPMKNFDNLILAIVGVIEILVKHRNDAHCELDMLIVKYLLQFLDKLLCVAEDNNLLSSTELNKEQISRLFSSDYAIQQEVPLKLGEYHKAIYGTEANLEYAQFSSIKDDLNAISHNAFKDLNKLLAPWIDCLQKNGTSPTVEQQQEAEQRILAFYATYGRVAWQVIQSLAQQPKSDSVYVKAAMLLGNGQLTYDMLSNLTKQQYVSLLNTFDNKRLSEIMIQIKKLVIKIRAGGDVDMDLNAKSINLFAPNVIEQVRKQYQELGSNNQEFIFKIDDNAYYHCDLKGDGLIIKPINHDKTNTAPAPIFEQYITAILCHVTGNKSIDRQEGTGDTRAAVKTDLHLTK